MPVLCGDERGALLVMRQMKRNPQRPFVVISGCHLSLLVIVAQGVTSGSVGPQS